MAVRKKRVVDEIAAPVLEAFEKLQTYEGEIEKGKLPYAIKLGEELILAKGKIAHGSWKKWVETELPEELSLRSIQDYMLVADPKNKAKAQRAASLRKALEKIRDGKKDKPDLRVVSNDEPEPQQEEVPSEAEADESWQNDLYSQACSLVGDMFDGTRRRFFAFLREEYPDE